MTGHTVVYQLGGSDIHIGQKLSLNIYPAVQSIVYVKD